MEINAETCGPHWRTITVILAALDAAPVQGLTLFELTDRVPYGATTLRRAVYDAARRGLVVRVGERPSETRGGARGLWRRNPEPVDSSTVRELAADR